jgi:hypothetical protein
MSKKSSIKQLYACRVNEEMLRIYNVPYAETGGSFCLSSYSIVCLDVAGVIAVVCLIRFCVRDEYIFKNVVSQIFGAP